MNDKISKGLNSTFITLIPKKFEANRIQDFLPISLITAPYKRISKVLSNRIREVLHEVIKGNQYAFIKGRQIIDSILIANECIEDYRRRKHRGVVIKLDLEKAHDKTDWKLLDYIMARTAFGAKWRSWMFGCLSLAHLSIIINGSPKGFSRGSRGLRQGDPQFPFFLMAVDSLSQFITICRI